MMPLIQYLLIAFESFGLIYFFDSFFDADPKIKKGILYLVCYAEIIAAISATSLAFPNYGDIVKSILIVILLILDCVCFYHAGLMTAVFFSGVNYILLFYADCVVVNISGLQDSSVNHVVWVGLKVVWLGLLVFIRKKVPHIKRYLQNNKVSWARFTWLPVFSGFVGIYFYYTFLSDFKPSLFYSFISLGLLGLNVISLLFIQDQLLKEEKLQQFKMQNQKNQNQLQIFHDMRSLTERQGKMLHDYKKQLVTVQGLIESGDTASAVKLTQELTKSISVEMSEVNTGHPVVNAVLNQEYRIAKGMGIGMIFSITEADKIRLRDEDIVVVLGNLLDNAIHECERIVESGKDAVIQIKMAYMDGEMIITVQNPVYEPVDIENGEVVGKQKDGHGIGLANVRETVEKYDGSFAISCDENGFTAVVVI